MTFRQIKPFHQFAKLLCVAEVFRTENEPIFSERVFGLHLIDTMCIL